MRWRTVIVGIIVVLVLLLVAWVISRPLCSCGPSPTATPAALEQIARELQALIAH